MEICTHEKNIRIIGEILLIEQMIPVKEEIYFTQRLILIEVKYMKLLRNFHGLLVSCWLYIPNENFIWKSRIF